MSDAPLQNPYRSPAEVEPPTGRHQAIAQLAESGSIEFRGAPTEIDIESYLQSHEHVGCGSMMITLIVVSFIMFAFAATVGGGMVLIAVSVIGLLMVSYIVSLPVYRRSMFLSDNPNWNAEIAGHIDPTGVRVERSGATTFFAWDWFLGGVTSQQTVGLIPAIHGNHPLLISAAMVTKLGDWDRLISVVQALDLLEHSDTDPQTRPYNVRSVLCSRKRRSTVPAKAGDIEFSGAVTSDDFRYLPGRAQSEARTLRATMVTVALVLLSVLAIVGVFRLFGIRSVLIPIVLFGSLALVWSGVRRRRQSHTRHQSVFFQRAIASDRGITLDFEITIARIPWQQLSWAYWQSDVITMTRNEIRQFIIARKDMFADPQSFQDFQRLVESKLEPPTSLHQ